MAKKVPTKIEKDYDSILSDLSELLEQSRRLTARSVNAIMTATYWEIGRQIVEVKQKGEERAEYGKELLKKLSKDLTDKFGRGFSERNLEQMRLFYLTWQISQTLSAKSADAKNPTVSRIFTIEDIAKSFPLPWSHYTLLLSCKDKNEREFYETESLRGGWSVRQLKRQKDSQFYKRTLLSKNKAAMLEKGEKGFARRFCFA